QVRQRRADQLMEGSRHHRKGALQPLARQIEKAAAIGKARGMDQRIDRTKSVVYRADQLGGGAGNGEIAAMPADLSAGLLALARDLLQAREAPVISALPVQHQPLARRRQTPRNRGADAGATAGND